MTPELFAEAIQEFKELYKQEYGVDLSKNEASEKANALLHLFQSLTDDSGKGVQ